MELCDDVINPILHYRDLIEHYERFRITLGFIDAGFEEGFIDSCYSTTFFWMRPHRNRLSPTSRMKTGPAIERIIWSGDPMFWKAE